MATFAFSSRIFSRLRFVLDYMRVVSYYRYMESNIMTNETKLNLWVSNMDVAGANSDYTEDYLREAGATDIMTRHIGVTLKGQTLTGSDPEALFAAYVDLRAAVAAAGHGVDDEELPEPELVASISGRDEGAAKGLERLVSATANSWADFYREALVGDR